MTYMSPLLLADPTQVVVALIFTAISIATAYYATSQASKAARKAQPDFFEPSQVTQGARIHWVHGHARIPAIVGWVGNRFQFNIRKGGGGKGGSKTVLGPYFVEDAWHQLCIGPGASIKRIWVDDALIWDYTKGIKEYSTGPGAPVFTATPDGITPEIAPSGTHVKVGQAAQGDYQFVVMWGDDDQDVWDIADGAAPGTINIQSVSEVTGIASRFPRVVSLFWYGFPLGAAPRWPQVDVEVEAYGVVGAASNPCSTDTVTVAGDEGDSVFSGDTTSGGNTAGSGSEDISFSFDYAVADAGWYRVDGLLDLYLHFAGSGTVDYYGQPMSVVLSNGVDSYTLLDEDVPTGWLDTGDYEEHGCWFGQYGGGVMHHNRTLSRIFLELEADTWTMTVTLLGVTRTSASDQRLTIEAPFSLLLLENPVVSPVTGGASFLRRLLFGQFPQGLGLPESRFDTDSIDTVESELETEGLVTSVSTKDETASQILGAWCADMGVAFYLDQEDGLYHFRRIRAETEAAVIDPGLQATILPQVEVYHGPLQADAIAYSFRDPDREYKPSVLPQADDGHADEQGMIQARQVDLTTAGDFATASKIAQRRQQEDLGNNTVYTFQLKRAAALIKPGDLIRMGQSFEVTPYLRVLSVQRNDSNNCTIVKAAIDSYAVAHVDYAGDDAGGTSAPFDEAAIDVAFDFLEVPDDLARLAGIPRPTIAIMRGRATDGITYADILISEDGTNYDNVDRTTTTMFAGELAADWDATGWILDEGPEITSLGVPDLDGLQDLSSDQATWRRGAQVMVVGEEVTYIQKLTPVTAPDLWRADGVIRARFDSQRATHATGTKVYIFTLEDLAMIQDARLAPSAEISVKTLPGTPNDVVDAADVTAVTKTLVGKGVVPQRVASLRESRGIKSYRTGQDVTLEWGYRNPVTPGSGAGHQGYGMPTNVDPVRGTFEVRVYDNTDALVRTESAGTALTWTYDNADLVTDLGGETDFRVEVYNADGGLRSEPASIDIIFN